MRTKPATAYDYRRYLALVQVLALEGSGTGIRHLCDIWNVEPVWVNPDGSYLNVWATTRKLARHVIEYTRENRNDL